jgi:hypothetical protein
LNGLFFTIRLTVNDKKGYALYSKCAGIQPGMGVELWWFVTRLLSRRGVYGDVKSFIINSLKYPLAHIGFSALFLNFFNF